MFQPMWSFPLKKIDKLNFALQLFGVETTNYHVLTCYMHGYGA